MSRVRSLAAVSDDDAIAGRDTEIVLIFITHPDLPEPVRLSSDPTALLAEETLARGTYSTWQTNGGEPFLYILAEVVLPDESDEQPEATLVIELLDARLAELLTSTIEPATADFAVVMRSSPDVVEHQVLGLRLASAEGDSGLVALTFAAEPLLEERFPAERTTKERFPGLHT